jgi:hypothetical protein
VAPELAFAIHAREREFVVLAVVSNVGALAWSMVVLDNIVCGLFTPVCLVRRMWYGVLIDNPESVYDDAVLSVREAAVFHVRKTAVCFSMSSNGVSNALGPDVVIFRTRIVVPPIVISMVGE